MFMVLPREGVVILAFSFFVYFFIYVNIRTTIMSRLKLYSSKLFALEDFEDSDVAILPDEQQAKNMAEVQENLNMIETASDTMNTVIEDSHLTENIAEIVEDAAEAGEGVSETAVTLIQEAVESIYRRHGMPKRYYPKIPSLEAYGGNRIKTAKAIRHQLKVSIEDGFIDTIKSIWEKICNFFSELWGKITGNSDSDANKASELQKRIKKVMDDKKPFPKDKYATGTADKKEWFDSVTGWLKATSDVAKDFDAWIKDLIDNFIKSIGNKEGREEENKKEDQAVEEMFKEINDKLSAKIVDILGSMENVKKDELIKDGKLDNDGFKELVKTRGKELLAKVNESEQSDVNRKNASTFPKETGWQDLHDLAGNINMSAKECKNAGNFVKEKFEAEDVKKAIADASKESDAVKAAVEHIKEKAILSATIVASKASLHKSLLDIIEKAVKAGEEAKASS